MANGDTFGETGMQDLPGSAARFAAEAARLGLSISVRIMPGGTRTAAEAAEACGADIARIVKSLVFLGADTGRPHLLLVSGANRVNEAAVGAALGEALARPDGAAVRALTGFAIGGVPPFGHTTPLDTYLDRELLAFSRVWAAAGTPHTMFEIAPHELARVTGATAMSMTGA